MTTKKIGQKEESFNKRVADSNEIADWIEDLMTKGGVDMSGMLRYELVYKMIKLQDNFSAEAKPERLNVEFKHMDIFQDQAKQHRKVFLVSPVLRGGWGIVFWSNMEDEWCVDDGDSHDDEEDHQILSHSAISKATGWAPAPVSVTSLKSMLDEGFVVDK